MNNTTHQDYADFGAQVAGLLDAHRLAKFPTDQLLERILDVAAVCNIHGYQECEQEL